MVTVRGWQGDSGMTGELDGDLDSGVVRADDHDVLSGEALRWRVRMSASRRAA
jgi:hypothetical protein